MLSIETLPLFISPTPIPFQLPPSPTPIPFQLPPNTDSPYCSLQEFMLAIDISSMGSPEQKLNWAFRMYDINGDGYVQPNEMIEIITVGTRARTRV